MDVYVLNTNYQVTFILDHYESFMWVDRYYDCGEFEIYTPFRSDYINNLIQGYYLRIDSSDTTMIIETIQVETNVDTGSKLIIKGRSIESILDRRIIWPTKIIKNEDCYLEQTIRQLLTETIINPTSAFGHNSWRLRQIDNFIFEYADQDSGISNLTIEPVELTGDNLYDVIRNWCEEAEISYRIKLVNDGGFKFKFKLYKGEDRSYRQIRNTYVIFSPEFDNIVSTDYIDDISTYKNFAVIQGETDTKYYGNLDTETGSGLNHKELYVDARDIQQGELPQGQSYNSALLARGLEKLNENSRTVEFTGEVEAKRQYVYGVDFFCGDVIEIIDTYGIEGSARVVEFIINETSNGIEMYPTFECLPVDTFSEDEED